MWFFKGFGLGIGILLIIFAVIAVLSFVVVAPFFVFQELFGEPNGNYIALVFEVVVGAGLTGAWVAYECRPKIKIKEEDQRGN